MVRDLLPDAPVGIFIHTPFPSSEIFRCLPRKQKVLQMHKEKIHVMFIFVLFVDRKELLTGILGANLVGFQVGHV
jgi:trehalose 6-phosphate synthase/phosphatase